MWDRKTLPRVHLIGCQGVKLFLLKIQFFKLSKKLSCQKLIIVSIWGLRCHNLSFTRFVTIFFEWQKMFVEWPKHFEYLSFVTFWVFELQILNLWVVLFWVFELCHIWSFNTLLVFEFCHILIFWVWSLWDLFSYVKFRFLSHLDCLSFVTFVVWEFRHIWFFF